MKLLNHKETSKKSGVYCIENTINKKKYIGSAKNLYTRSSWHKSALLNNKHHCHHLQKSVNKYGIDNFIIYVLEFTQLLRKRESFYTNLFNATDRKFGYNLAIVNEDSVNLSEETKQKISLAMKGRKPEKALLKSKEMIAAGISPQKGRMQTLAATEKMLETKKNWSDERKEEYRLKQSILSKNRNTNYQSKKTALLNSNLELIKIYDSAKDIVIDYPELNASTITKICRGEQKKKIYKNYSFEYI